MTRLVACFLAAQVILLPVYALYIWAVPGRAGARFPWSLHRVAFLLALVLPFALLVPSPVSAPRPVERLAASVSRVITPPARLQPTTQPTARTDSTSSPLTFLLLIPSGGGLVFCVRLGRQKTRERILARKGTRRRFGRVEIIITAATRVPFSTGLLRPRIFLPAGIAAKPRSLAMVFGHEAVHLRRGDWLWTVAESFAAHLLWFNPMMHVLARGGGRVRELLCDAEVCRKCSPAEYGRLLLETAAGTARARPPLLADAWVQRGFLKERIRFLVQGGRSFMKAKVRAASIGAGVLSAALLLAGLPFLTPAAAQGRAAQDTPNIESYPPVAAAAHITITSAFTTTSGESARTGLAMFDSASQAGITFGGMDFYAVVSDTQAVASADSFVEDISTADDGTTTISVVTASGYRIMYSHLSKPLVTFREFVRAGQSLGTLAPSTSSLGEFSLHYEVWKDGRQVDPFPPSVYDISTGKAATP